MILNCIYDHQEKVSRYPIGVVAALLMHGMVIWGLIAYAASSTPTMKTTLFTPPASIAVQFVKIPAPVQSIQKTVAPPPQVKPAPPVKKKVLPKKVVAKKPAPMVKKAFKPIVPKMAPVRSSMVQPTAFSSITPVATASTPATPVQQTIPVTRRVQTRGRNIQPVYPKRALRMRQEGTVWLRVLIGKDGKRQQINVHKPSQYPLLNKAALNAVKRWKFIPHQVAGEVTTAWVEVPIEFKIR